MRHAAVMRFQTPCLQGKDFHIDGPRFLKQLAK